MENITQQENISTATAPAPQSKPRPSKVFVFLIVLIIIVAIGSGAYFLGMQNLQPAAQPITTTQVIIKPTPTVDPTANWKTYTNAQYGFSFQYPLTWKIITETPKGFEIVPLDKQPFLKTSGKMFGKCDLYLAIPDHANALIAVNISNNTSDGSYCWSYGYFYDHVKRLITVLHPEKEIDISKWTQPAGNYNDTKIQKDNWRGDYFQSFTLFDKKQNVTFALLNQDNNRKETEELFDQVLSTFTFASTASPNPGENQNLDKDNPSISPPAGNSDY